MPRWPRWVCWLVAYGRRAAVVMSLIQSARLNGHAPYAYLEGALTRRPAHLTSEWSEAFIAPVRSR